MTLTVDALKETAIDPNTKEGFDFGNIPCDDSFPYFCRGFFDIITSVTLSDMLLLMYAGDAPDMGAYFTWYQQALCLFWEVTPEALREFAEEHMETMREFD